MQLQANQDRPRPIGMQLSHWRVTQQVRLLALLGLTLALIGLTALIIAPFFPALTWALALVIISWRLHQRISKRFTNPNLAAALTTMIVLSVILIPGALVSLQLAKEAGAIVSRVNEPPAAVVQQTIYGVPWLRQATTASESFGLNIEAEIATLVQRQISNMTGFIRGSLAGVIQFLVATFLFFFMTRDQAQFVGGLRNFLPLDRPDADRVFARVANSVHANLSATIVTSAINGGLGGFMFWWLGFSAPVLWGAVIFVLGVIPVLGSALVWIPAVLFLFGSGSVAKGMALLSWGLSSAIIVDHLIFARLAGSGMRMHPALVLLAFLGGVAVFGVTGMILGPAIVATTFTFVEGCRHHLANADVPANH